MKDLKLVEEPLQIANHDIYTHVLETTKLVRSLYDKPLL